MTRKVGRQRHTSRRSASADSSTRIQSLKVELVNRQRSSRLDTRALCTVIRRSLRAEGVRQGHIEVALVDDEAIRQVHREFLKLDTPTDVLTFPLHDRGEALAGLIVISVDTAVRAAARHRQTIDDEVRLYAIHGVLHLCGYDDTAPRDSQRMRRRQMSLLRQFRLPVFATHEKSATTNQKRRRMKRNH